MSKESKDAQVHPGNSVGRRHPLLREKQGNSSLVGNYRPITDSSSLAIHSIQHQTPYNTLVILPFALPFLRLPLVGLAGLLDVHSGSKIGNHFFYLFGFLSCPAASGPCAFPRRPLARHPTNLPMCDLLPPPGSRSRKDANTARPAEGEDEEGGRPPNFEHWPVGMAGE